MTVRVESVTKRFGGEAEAAAVNGVSFEAREGEITALLGPSGSGKSTLLRLVAGLEEPDGGRVFIGGRDCTRVGPRDRNVGFVFQSYALFKHLTVFDNVAFGLSVRKRPKAEIRKRVDELLALVQLPAYADRFPSELSGGQRQRVALARALATNPRVLLLDEPFGALDTRVRVELREWLARILRQTKITTLLVTHDQEEAFEMSSHVVLLHDGRVAQAGSPHDIYDSPANPFVASFLGAANKLSGMVKDGRVEAFALAVNAPEGASDGAQIEAFVRPHDVRVLKSDGQGERDDVSPARVERLTRIGANVKLALELPDGESMIVQMSKSEADAIGIELGDRVLVDCRDAKVFVSDYVI